MSGRSIPVPSTLTAQIRHYCENKKLTEFLFADKCGLSHTAVNRIIRGQRTAYSSYSAKRINQVLHNGQDFSGSSRITRGNVSVGKLTPVPSWVIPPLRSLIETGGGQTKVGAMIGVDGGALRKVVDGKQIVMRKGNLDKVIAWLHGGNKKPNGEARPTLPAAQTRLPLDVHSQEMNQIIDAFNRWTDQQREAVANLAHAFSKKAEDATKDDTIAALRSLVKELEADLSSAEADACKWENEYHKLKARVDGMTKLLQGGN